MAGNLPVDNKQAGRLLVEAQWHQLAFLEIVENILSIKEQDERDRQTIHGRGWARVFQVGVFRELCRENGQNERSPMAGSKLGHQRDYIL